MSKEYFGKIIKTHEDGVTFIINRGSKDGVEMGSRFVIMEIGDEIFDPETGESLGQLEIVKGKVSPSHIQDKMTTITSAEYITEPERKEIRYYTSNTGGRNDNFWQLTNPYGSRGREKPIETIIAGEKKIKKLRDVKVGDVVKLISRY